jgi:Transposase DDE domain
MPWTFLNENRAAVAEKLRRGEYDGLVQTGMGRADELVYLMASLKFFEHLDQVEVVEERAGIPNDVQKRCLALLPVVGIPTIANTPARLFKDAGLLHFLGCNAQQIANGFTQRGPKKKNQQPKRLPFHEDDLRNLLKAITPTQSQRFFTGCIGEFFRAKYVRGGIHAIDGTEILVGDAKTFEGTGTITVPVHHKDGSTTYETKTGYKLIYLLNLKPDREVVVSYRLVPLNTHALQVVREMVTETLDLGGAGAIELLLMDREFVDGDLINWLTGDHGIDVIIPVKENMDILADMRGLARIDQRPWQTYTKLVRRRVHKDQPKQKVVAHVRVKGFEGLTTWSSCHLPLNGILRLKDDETPNDAHGLVTTLPVQDAIRIDRQYGARWGIENDGNRELKQGWDLETLWGRTLAAVTMSVVMKLLGYNYVKLFHTRSGSRLIANGMRRLRARVLDEGFQVIVYAGNEFGVFHIEEIATLLGAPPKMSFRRATDVSPP